MVTTPNATAARRQKRRCVADGLYGSFPDDALLAIEAVSEIETRDLSPTDRCFVDETSLAKALEAYTAYVDDASPVAEAERIRLRHRRGWPADEWCFGEGVDWQTAFARYGVAGTTAEVSDGLEMSPPRSRLLSFLTWSQSPLFPHDATLVSYHFRTTLGYSAAFSQETSKTAPSSSPSGCPARQTSGSPSGSPSSGVSSSLRA